jgi:LysM repeat protein
MTSPRFTSATYHANLQVAEFICDDGRHLLRSGGTLPWRINNCGDLMSPLDGQQQPAPKKTKNFIGFAKIPSKQTPVVNHFFIFPDYAAGREQLELSLKRRYGQKTVAQMVEKFAPSHENDASKYLKNLLREAAISDDATIGELDDGKFNALADSIEKLEGFHNESASRKETWVGVSHIIATDGARPLADEEIVLRVNGKDTVLKSNEVGQFQPIAHADQPIQVLHRTADNELKPVGSISGDKGQNLSLLTRVQRYSGMSGPETPSSDSTGRRHPFVYQVQPKDTLGGIAKRFETTAEKIKQDNGRRTDRLFAGETLGIYGPPPADSTPTQTPRKSPPKPAARASASAAPAPAPAAAPAASSATKQAPPAAHVAKIARSDAGAGKPLAIIDPDPARAPWMVYAIAEAKRFKGATESQIEKYINYATIVGTGQTTLVGDDHPWCAAFANWCLMKAGYPIDNPDFFDHRAELGRAHAFDFTKGPRQTLSEIEVNVKDKSGKEKKVIKIIYKNIEPKVRNPLFSKLEKPLYGAIAVVHSIRSNKGHHVGFVYSQSKDGNHVALLGGNQSQRIKFSQYEIKNKADELHFFVPAAYAKQASKDADESLLVADADNLNDSFGIAIPKTKKNEDR